MENITLVQVIVLGGLIAVFIENIISLRKRKSRIEKIKELVKADFKKYLGIVELIRDSAVICAYLPFKAYSAHGFGHEWA